MKLQQARPLRPSERGQLREAPIVPPNRWLRSHWWLSAAFRDVQPHEVREFVGGLFVVFLVFAVVLWGVL